MRSDIKLGECSRTDISNIHKVLENQENEVVNTKTILRLDFLNNPLATAVSLLIMGVKH